MPMPCQDFSLQPSASPLASLLAPALQKLDMPAVLRQAMGGYLRHLALGERVAQRSATRQAVLAPSLSSARFLRKQARHEALHFRIFDTAAACLGAPALTICDCPYAAFDQYLAAAAHRGDYADTVVGTQRIIDALGEVLLGRLDIGLDRYRFGLHRLRRLLRAQEASHHAFGVAELAALADSVPGGAAALARLEPPYRRLASRMIEAGAPILRTFDLTPDDIQHDLDSVLAGASLA